MLISERFALLSSSEDVPRDDRMAIAILAQGNRLELE